MKYLFSFVFLFTSIGSVQSQSDDYARALQQFQLHYNNKDAQQIFELFNANMQKKVSLEMSQQIVTTFHAQFGELISVVFFDEQEALEKYVGYFQKGKLNISIVLDIDKKISGLLFKPFENTEPSLLERNQTSLSLPFKGEWFTFWGGDTKGQNYHVTSRPQKGAFDFIKLGKSGLSYERSGTRNEDYYAFGKPLYAVCDATVVMVTKGVRDNKPGEMNPAQALGNSVILKTDNDEYVVYAHFEETTLKVSEGDTVVKGQYLGNCGNSGNSSEPHLHLHIQDGLDILNSGGVKCFFESVEVNGTTQQDYSPVKNDRISPVKI